MGLRQFVLPLAAFLSIAPLYAAPKLRLTAATVGPVSVAAGSNPASQTVEAYNAGDGSLTLSVSTSASWVAGSAGAARACTTRTGTCIPLQFTFTTASLAAGMYTATATVTSATALDAPQTITITVQAGGGVPDRVDLYAPPNGVAEARFYTNSGTVAGRSTTPWMALSLEGSGSFRFAFPYLIRATSPASSATEATYIGAMTISGSGLAAENKTVNVNFRVTSQPIATVSPDKVQVTLAQGAPKTTTYLSLANAGRGNLTVQGGSSSSTWVTVGSPIGTLLPLTFDTSNVSPGVNTGSLTVTTNAANATLTVPLEFRVVAPAAPTITFQGVVNNATFEAGLPLGAGEIVALMGDQLSMQAPAVASTFPWPTQLGGTRVLVNGTPAPIYYSSYNQVNFQLPYGLSVGTAEIRAERDGQAGNTVSVDTQPIAPRVLLNSYQYGIVINSDGSYAMPSTAGLASHAAKAGDALVIYALGLGATDPPAAAGAAAPAREPLARVPGNVSVLIGNPFDLNQAQVTPLFVGLTPGFSGLYQINFVVPENTPKGASVALALSVGGVNSNVTQIAIQ